MEELTKSLQPTTLVIFGITGDLAHRKLLPALYDLAKQDLLPAYFRVVGVTRRGTTNEKLLESIRLWLRESGKTCDQKVLDKLNKIIEIFAMDLLQTDEYTRLRRRLDEIEVEVNMCMNRLFYLAIPAQTFGPVVQQLGQSGLNASCPHGTGASRLLIEKPFGYDLSSAHELIDDLGKHFNEEQIYRIDHYLAKETAQNILNFRFQNPIFKPIWNNKCVSHITITAAEEIGIEGRSVFYEQTGALRDFVQSHMLQLLALATMDEPEDLSSAEIHRKKLELLKAITPIAPNMVASQTVRGQYASYRDEVQNPDSLTETYAALRLEIANDRWRGVPILLRTGKALAEKLVDITIIFSDSGKLTKDNMLTIRIQPNEGISLLLLAKKPGFSNETEPAQMDFCYDTSFDGTNDHPDPYERVLMDAFRGDKTLFSTSDEVLASWRVLENVIHEWSKDSNDLQTYHQHSWGPDTANDLAKNAGTAWLSQELNVCLPPRVAPKT